jgi:predicted Zn-dependent peptidase
VFPWQHRAADIVAVYLWVATGVRHESPETLGHAHFQEHMLFKGTDRFGPGHIDRAIEGTGGRSNAFTTFDYTTYQAAAELAGVGYEFFDVYAANVRKVTRADVQRVAKQYLGVMRTVIVQPP